MLEEFTPDLYTNAKHLYTYFLVKCGGIAPVSGKVLPGFSSLTFQERKLWYEALRADELEKTTKYMEAIEAL